MAAADQNKTSCWRVPEVYKHHEQRKICISRPSYREGRRAKAVKVQICLKYQTIHPKINITSRGGFLVVRLKVHGRSNRVIPTLQVYTINLESRYLMVQGVPAIGVMTELIQLCALYGVVEEYRPLDEYPAEEFTEVYLVKFQRLTSAR